MPGARHSVPKRDNTTNSSTVTWSCPNCAVLNPGVFLKCDVCGAPKPEEATSKGAFTTSQGQAMQRAREDMYELDINRDGVVDASEFVAAGGTQEEFEQLDGNKDGKLDVDELTQHAAMHPEEEVHSEPKVRDQVLERQRNELASQLSSGSNAIVPPPPGKPPLKVEASETELPVPIPNPPNPPVSQETTEAPEKPVFVSSPKSSHSRRNRSPEHSPRHSSEPPSPTSRAEDAQVRVAAAKAAAEEGAAKAAAAQSAREARMSRSAEASNSCPKEAYQSDATGCQKECLEPECPIAAAARAAMQHHILTSPRSPQSQQRSSMEEETTYTYRRPLAAQADARKAVVTDEEKEPPAPAPAEVQSPVLKPPQLDQGSKPDSRIRQIFVDDGDTTYSVHTSTPLKPAMCGCRPAECAIS